jgi:large subunit ribosomal protein L2
MKQDAGLKRLRHILPKISGRDVGGHVSVRHQGGRHKRYYRVVDWKRTKENVPARVVSIEYDPNRTGNIALLQFADGEKQYMLAPDGLAVDQKIITSDSADISVGNTLRLSAIPVGTIVHGLEIKPGHGAQIARSAGTSVTVLAKDAGKVQVKLTSGELRLFDEKCRATVGQVSNIDWRNEVIGKAGRSRHMGIRPTVRGVAQNPRSHPHGGGEGRSGIGMPSPKSPWGKKTLGKKTRNKTKYSNKFILERRKK